MKIASLTSALLLTATICMGQVTGPTSVIVGQTAQYIYYGTAVYPTYTWSVSASKGYVGSTSRTGTTYYASITWTSAGSSTISFSAYGQAPATLNVTITCPTAATPSTTFSYSSNVCGNQTISYSGGPPAGVTWYWQTYSGGTDQTYSSSSYTISASGNYYLRAKPNCSSTWSAALTTAYRTYYPVPGTPSPTMSTTSICGTGSVTLYGSGGGANDQVRWYNVASGGSPISTFQPNISSTTTFYAALYNTQSGCEGARAAATVTVYPLPGTPTITSPSGNVSQCNGAAIITLTSDTPANTSYFQWYKDGNAISGATSSGYTIFLGDQLPHAGSYTVSAIGAGGYCSSLQSAARVITINSMPSVNPGVSPGSAAICGGTIAITVTGSESGVNYQLYMGASPISGAVSGGGTINITSNPMSTSGTITVRATNSSSGCTTLLNGNTALTVNTVPGAAGGSVSPNTLCGAGTVTWSASGAGTNEVYRWYTASSGGTPISPATSVSTTTTSYVSRYNTVTGCEGNRTAVTVTVNTAITTAPTVTGHSRFGTGPLTLTGNGNPLGTNYRWYTFTNTLLSTGPTYPIASVSASATNYMKVSSLSTAGCEGPQTVININVYSQPVVTAPQNYVVKETPVTLTASAGNETYTWRNSANAIVQTGSSPTYNATLPDTYTVTALRTGATSLAIPYTLNGPLVGVNMNYVVSNNVLALNITDPVQVPNLASEKVTQTIAYFDGLGRPLQNVATQASPLKADLVTPVKYDQYGRQAKEYLPYISFIGGVAENTGRYKSNDLTGQATFYNPATTYLNKVKTDGSPWAETVFEASPLNRISQKGAPGAVWQPNVVPANGKTIKMEYLANVDGTGANQERVKIWTLTSVTLASGTEFILSSSAYYPSNTLFVNVTKDEENRQVREYKDKLGKVILKKVQEAVTPAINVDTDWTLTYYIYDDFERLRFVLQPKFIHRNSNYDALGTNQLKKDMLDSLTFEYRYDDRGRMIYKRVPGAKQVDMVYDQWDRLVLSRDGNQKAGSRWSFTKYDVLNRPIITGEIASANTRDQMVTALAGVTPRYETATSGNGVGYTLNQTYPTTATINDIYTITYYDDYSFKTNLALGTAYDASIPSGFTGVVSTRLKNLVTGSKIRVLQSSPLQWLVTASYYDDRYRLIQSIGDDHLNNKNKITNEYYGLTPWITKSQLNHGTALTSLTETFYDHMGRVKEVWQTMDNLPATRTLLASHKYNELGELVEKNIHSTNSGTTFLQYNDYRYNIRGWLTHINNSTLTPDALINDNDPTSDLFGMELKYNDIVSINGVNTKEQYNGNISAIQWKTNNLVDAPTEKIYGFKYDQLNRLTDATYATKNGSLWNSNVNLFDENLAYDKNGNIRTLKRKSLYNSSTNALVDDLVYKYKGNQLDAVLDNATATYKPYGFAESTTLTTGEYTYDANGSMEVDQNKGLVGPTVPDPKGVLYNHLNLPREVRFGNKKILYTYDAAGTKLRKVAYDNSGVLISRTDYVGGIQYEGLQALTNPPLAADLKFMITSEGRAVKNAGVWQYEYFHKDHLGNSRVVYGYQKQVDEYKATMETPLATKEQGQFYNLTTTRVTAFNRTPASIDVVTPDKSAETNGNLAGKAIGPAKMLQVAAGDRVQLEVFARYATGTGSNTTLISNLASAVTGSFMLTAGEAAHTAITNNVPARAATITQTGGVPKAYLFYILFNSSYVYQQFGYVAVNSSALVGHQQMYLDITIPTGGFLYTYVANESNVSSATSVYFDDFNIIHTRNTSTLQVVQTTDYYPFGLAIVAQSYQKQSSLDNDYLYNGKELQDEHNLGWLDYGARMYMPEIGRWGAIDPVSEEYLEFTPYQYVRNNPVILFDINGMYDQELANKWEKEDLEQSGFNYQAVKGNDQPQQQDKVKLKDASFQQIMTAFQAVHILRHSAAEKGEEIDINLYDLFDTEGAPMQSNERVGNYFEKNYIINGHKAYVFILLPTYRKDARIDAATTYFPGEPLVRQKGFREDLDNISTEGVPRGYGIGLYSLGIDHGRMAAVEFEDKDTFITWRSNIFIYEKRFQKPTSIKLPNKM